MYIFSHAGRRRHAENLAIGVTGSEFPVAAAAAAALPWHCQGSEMEELLKLKEEQLATATRVSPAG
jgi:hypothetical protein